MSIYLQIFGDAELEIERRRLMKLRETISANLNSFRRDMVATTEYTFGGATCVDRAPEMVVKRDEYNQRMKDFHVQEVAYNERVRQLPEHETQHECCDYCDDSEERFWRNHAERRFR